VFLFGRKLAAEVMVAMVAGWASAFFRLSPDAIQPGSSNKIMGGGWSRNI
jgi:hypothetical protein